MSVVALFGVVRYWAKLANIYQIDIRIAVALPDIEDDSFANEL